MRNKLAGTYIAPQHRAMARPTDNTAPVGGLPPACCLWGPAAGLHCRHCSCKVCIFEVEASRLQLLRDYAQNFVWGLQSGSFQDVAAVHLLSVSCATGMKAVMLAHGCRCRSDLQEAGCCPALHHTALRPLEMLKPSEHGLVGSMV